MSSPVGSTARSVRARRPCGDDGTATAMVLGLAAVLLLCGTVATTLGAVAVARHRAASAADLSALAAAASVLEGPEAACERARQIVAEVAALLSRCDVDGDRVDVVVEVRPAGPLGRLGTASVRAAAGPVPPDVG